MQVLDRGQNPKQQFLGKILGIQSLLHNAVEQVTPAHEVHHQIHRLVRLRSPINAKDTEGSNKRTDTYGEARRHAHFGQLINQHCQHEGEDRTPRRKGECATERPCAAVHTADIAGSEVSSRPISSSHTVFFHVTQVLARMLSEGGERKRNGDALTLEWKSTNKFRIKLLPGLTQRSRISFR